MSTASIMAAMMPILFSSLATYGYPAIAGVGFGAGALTEGAIAGGGVAGKRVWLAIGGSVVSGADVSLPFPLLP